MKRTRRFIPSATDQLEWRVVLSQTTLGLSTVVSGLAPHLQVLNRKQTALVAEVNQAFGSFQNDFDQARATYFASIQNDTASLQPATDAFQEYTQQRTLLLAQQLVSSFVQTPQGTAKAKGEPSALKPLIEGKVIGPKGKGPAGSLIDSLKNSISSMSGVMEAEATSTSSMTSTATSPTSTASPMTPPVLASSPTTTLYTLSQDNAIQTARTAVLNGVSIIKEGAFGIEKKSQF